MCHVTHINEWCHTYANELRHTKWVMSHTMMHVRHISYYIRISYVQWCMYHIHYIHSCSLALSRYSIWILYEYLSRYSCSVANESYHSHIQRCVYALYVTYNDECTHYMTASASFCTHWVTYNDACTHYMNSARDYMNSARDKTIWIAREICSEWVISYTLMRVPHILYTCMYIYMYVYKKDIPVNREKTQSRGSMCDRTHSHAWHDSFTCVTWLIHMCDMKKAYL